MTRSAKSSRKQTKGSLTLFLLLFSLPFLGVGIGMSTVVALNLLKVHRMRNWAETEARIAATELKVSHGDDSTSYRVTATYQYSYEGRRYTGDRVSIHTGSDSIGKFHHRMHQRLQQAMNSGEPVPCYVNPDDPAQAVLVRTLRIEMVAFQAVFGLVFGGAGLAVLVGGLNARRSGRHSAALKTQHPDQPWLWRTSWAKGEIRSSGRTGAIALCLFAGVWWLISAPLTWHVIQHELPAGNRTALWVLLFPAVGLLILWGALYGLLRFVKYGVSVLQLSPMPGMIGGPLSGVVRVTRQIRPENGFQLKLTCINKVTTRSGKNTSTTEHVLWQDQHRIERELLAHDPTQTAIPVQFGIPFAERECDESNSNSTIEWRLEVTAKTPGIDYAAKFTVPVFKTDQSSPDYQPEAGLMAQYRANETPEEMLAAAGLRLTRLPTGTRVVCPPAKDQAGPRHLAVCGHLDRCRHIHDQGRCADPVSDRVRTVRLASGLHGPGPLVSGSQPRCRPWTGCRPGDIPGDPLPDHPPVDGRAQRIEHQANDAIRQHRLLQYPFQSAGQVDHHRALRGAAHRCRTRPTGAATDCERRAWLTPDAPGCDSRTRATTCACCSPCWPR